jgi:hypothetical protein
VILTKVTTLFNFRICLTVVTGHIPNVPYSKLPHPNITIYVVMCRTEQLNVAPWKQISSIAEVGIFLTLYLFHFIFTVHLFIIELFVPKNALRQFFHCFLYYMDAPIRISAVILPSSGGILSEFFYIDQFFG